MNEVHNSTVVGSFSRSQVAGLVASAVDYGVLFGLVELFRVYYVIAVAIGAFLGAVTSFLMNRHWSFRAAHLEVHGQVFRYGWVSAISLILNTGGTYAVTEHFKLAYGFSVIIVSCMVALGFNFPLHRYYVFK